MNMSTTFLAEDRCARYDLELPSGRAGYVVYAWPERIRAPLDARIIQLIRVTSASSPIIGFAETISDSQAAVYIKELAASLNAREWRLLTISTDTGELVGMCTLLRNSNPNNCHIGDLAKGMISQAYRGRFLLSAAFYEIALQCERDGIELLTLDVRADTPAQHIWMRYGFQIYGTLQDYARSQGKRFAGHFMAQPVSDLKARALKTLPVSRVPLVEPDRQVPMSVAHGAP